MEIFKKFKPKALISAALCLSMLSPVAAPLTAFAEEGEKTEYASTRERIETEYTLTDEVEDWSDPSQKNYQIAEGSTDDNYLLKSVEWTDIDKGEATITLAGKNTEESVALFVFTTCTDHMTTGSDRNGGLMPGIVLQDIRELQEMYDRVDCICVNGPGTWMTLTEGNITAEQLYSRTTDSTGNKVWNPAKYTFNVEAAVRAAGGVDHYYSGFTPVHSFSRTDSEASVKNWISNLAWIYGGHNTASELAAIRAYMFGDLSDTTYSDAQSNPTRYKNAITSALQADIGIENVVNRPSAIYVAGDSYVTMPNANPKDSLALTREDVCGYSADDAWIKFLAKYYTSYGDGETRYFSLTSSREHIRMEGSYDASDSYSDKTIKAYTATFHPEVVAKNPSARVVKHGASGTVTFASQGTTEYAADYEYQQDFRTAGVLTPDKAVSLADSVPDIFSITSVQAFTSFDVGMNVKTNGQDITATAKKYLPGDELTMIINVKLKTGTSTQLQGESISMGKDAARLMDGNMDMLTVNPILALPGADLITTDIRVVCCFDDDNDRDGIRPDIVTVTLEGSDGSRYSKEISSINAGSLLFEGLLTGIGDEKIKYSITAALPSGYKISESSSAKTEEGYQITATFYHKPQTKSVVVTKAWDDKDDVDGKRPDSITVKLIGSDGTSFTKKLYENNGWTATVDDLYAYYNHGQDMEYSLEEVSVEGYESKVSKDDSGNFLIKNIHTQEMRSLFASVEWADDDNRDGLRPKTVKVILAGSDGNTYEGSIKEADGWEYEFTDIPVNYDGKQISYTLTESVPDGYTGKVSVSQSKKGFEVTNTHKIAVKDITVKQTWVDEDNRDGIRPTKLKVTLKGSDGSERNMKLDDANEWSVAFKNLPVYFDEGKEIAYTLMEVTAAGYSTKTEAIDGGYAVTNTHTPEKRDITVVKVWDDSNDADGIRQDVYLILTGSDGNTYEGKILKDSADQEYVFKNLYVYANGAEIKYSLEEKEIEGYTASIAEAKDGFTLTNSHTASQKEDNDKPDDKDLWDGDDEQDTSVIKVPKTSDDFRLFDYGIIAVIAAGMVFGITLYVKRKKGDDADA